MASNTIIRLPSTFLQGHMNVISAARECFSSPRSLAFNTKCAATLFQPWRTMASSIQIMKWILPREAKRVSSFLVAASHCFSKLHTTCRETGHKGPSLVKYNLLSSINYSAAPAPARKCWLRLISCCWEFSIRAFDGFSAVLNGHSPVNWSKVNPNFLPPSQRPARPNELLRLARFCVSHQSPELQIARVMMTVCASCHATFLLWPTGDHSAFSESPLIATLRWTS